jgi:undecaprenyl-diphosphatase
MDAQPLPGDPDTQGVAGRGLPAWRARDQAWTRRLHRHGGTPRRRAWIVRVSRCGGVGGWAGLIGALAVAGTPHWAACARAMALVGAVNLLLYVAVKRIAGRPRPFAELAGLEPGDTTLDRFSFPSGHSLHAAAFAVLLLAWDTLAGLAAMAFAAVVGVSRVMLGLHYPSDVAAGFAIGAVTAAVALATL